MERRIMAIEKSTARDTKRRIELEDRERMTEKALTAIRRTGPAAALERCSRLADQIEAELSHRQLKDVIEPSEVEDLQAFLERAAAVLKKL
jgi:predicted transcriptional regulator of viral defense system